MRQLNGCSKPDLVQVYRSYDELAEKKNLTIYIKNHC